MRNAFALLGGSHVGALTRTRASEWRRFYLNLRLVGLYLYLWHVVLICVATHPPCRDTHDWRQPWGHGPKSCHVGVQIKKERAEMKRQLFVGLTGFCASIVSKRLVLRLAPGTMRCRKRTGSLKDLGCGMTDKLEIYFRKVEDLAFRHLCTSQQSGKSVSSLKLMHVQGSGYRDTLSVAIGTAIGRQSALGR